MSSKNTVCLWYNNDALDAARFYTATFPDSAVGALPHAPGACPDGAVLVAEFTAAGIPQLVCYADTCTRLHCAPDCVTAYATAP